ncbi:competence protein ComEA [Butyrivibrio sp. INlla18]|uniref:helix-hairpin-helix domain-containing protein n=1 Tax=Butyrivibrio sp. INlla18 TaxID=1520806 RepID=UPI00088252D4|nr:helix-hairpin-helix domain-containing protein [Butyrivibrio sp. INlla18]SDA50428.1 competence protein ComEA [Butyrivibrio sp. INlla18]
MRKYLVLIAALGLLLTGCTNANNGSDIILTEVTENETSSNSSSSDLCDSNEGASNTLVETSMVIYICGAVVSPGVYELPLGSRVNDAVIAAGGFSAEADHNYVNLAEPISDGIKIQIPTVQEVSTMQPVISGNFLNSDLGSGLININRASKEDLKTIPGIGDGIATKIVDYRTQNGNFSTIEDIMKVSGIKEKLFSKIKDYITV